MKFKLRRGPLIPIQTLRSWDKERQDEWMRQAYSENKDTVYLSEHLYDIFLVSMVAAALAMLLTGRIPLTP